MSSTPSKAESGRQPDEDKERSHRGNRTTVRLSNGSPFIEPGDCRLGGVVSRPLSGSASGDGNAASGVFCGLQVADFESFLRFFLCHFILLSNLVWPSVNFHLENSFLAVH